MKEFKCAGLGYRCAWSHIATQELLEHLITLHLGDVHGVTTVDSVLLGRIRSLFTDAAVVADPA